LKYLPIAFAFVSIGAAGYYATTKNRASTGASGSIENAVLDLDQIRFYARTVEQIETGAKPTKFPPVADRSLSDWLASSTSMVSAGGAVATEALLEKLSSDLPQISSATACVVYAGSVESLSQSIAGWASDIEPSFNRFATHVFTDPGSKQIGCAAVAIERLKHFSPANINAGEKSFYSRCRLCNGAHIGTIEQSYGAAALNCPHCGRAYELLAFKPDGNICRANELLEGWAPAVRLPKFKTEFEEMMFVWRKVLNHVRYAKDLQGLRGNLDTWQLASDTWKYKNGDCEDSTILLADWLIARGFDARVVIGTTATGEGHAWCVVSLNGATYLLETTEAIPDLKNPPYAATLGNRYIPRYQFNRDSIFYRTGQTKNPRYWSSKSWLQIDAKS
jgi:predicted transglutaminase-like cysteine proteinase